MGVLAHGADVRRGRAGQRWLLPCCCCAADLPGPTRSAMRAIGMIEVDRDSPDFRRIDRAAARSLAAGHSLLVYPEGTTSPDGAIGEFKDGAFIIAVTSQVPVLPVAIDGTGRIWPPGRTAIHHAAGGHDPQKVRVAVPFHAGELPVPRRSETGGPPPPGSWAGEPASRDRSPADGAIRPERRTDAGNCHASTFGIKSIQVILPGPRIRSQCTRATTAIISSSPRYRYPVRPWSMISGAAPLGDARTGVAAPRPCQGQATTCRRG